MSLPFCLALSPSLSQIPLGSLRTLHTSSSTYIFTCPSRNHNVLPSSRGVCGLPLPLLPACRRSMCRIWPPRAPGLEENHSRRLCLLRALAIKQPRGLCWWAKLLRLGLLQQPLEPGLISPGSVKCLVFGNGLPHVADFPIDYF